MKRRGGGRWLLLALAAAGLGAAEEPVVFRSEVALIRVDAQVLDSQNRAITGLRREDFVLRENGQIREIRNFATEEIPLDMLLLLDVSRSMRPHIERIGGAANEAVLVLGRQDRVGIMVFDRQVRMRMPLRLGVGDLGDEIERLLREEDFNGGTDITRALYEAGRYLGRNGRRDARRAIVIVTDDQTERQRDEDGVTRALTGADVVLSAIIAPDAMRSGRRSGGGGPLGRRGGWDDVIWGPRRYPRPGGSVSIGTRTAGTEEIARRTGGDSLRIEDADALETVFARIRQRYALHFYLPEGAKANEERRIEVELAAAARRRYPNAEVRYRRTYVTPAEGSGTEVSGTPEQAPVAAAGEKEVRGAEPAEEQEEEARAEEPRLKRRRPAVDEDGARRRGPASTGEAAEGWRRSTEAPVETEAEAPARRGGWRKATEEDLKP
jgi:VWFA-related protein